MNKKNLFISIIFLFLLSIIGCDRKDRLEGSNLLIDVIPNNATLLSQESMQFQAKVYSKNGKILDKQVVWSTDAGDINKAGLYTAPKISTPKTVSITASVDNISRTINLRLVNERSVKDNRYYFYADEFPYLQDMKLDTPNPGDVNGGCIGVIWDDTKISEELNDVYEGNLALKITLDNTPQNLGGIYFQFGYVSAVSRPIQITDLSNYNTIKFAIKSRLSASSLTLRIITVTDTYDFPINLNNYIEWGIAEFSIPQNGFALRQFRQLLFVTAAKTSGEFLLDNVYFEKK